MPPLRRQGRPRKAQGSDVRELGLRAFQRGRLSEAIAAWEPLAADPAVARALAEAYFRRALGAGAAEPIEDLRRAAALRPADTRFAFHLGRLLHRAGNRTAAAEQYRAALAREPGNVAAARLLALLTLEQRPSADLSALPWATPALRAWAEPARALLRGAPPPPDASALGGFWRGLGLLAAGDPGAAAALDDDRPLPTAALRSLRRYYRGAAAARGGDTAGALARWEQLYDAGDRPRGLEENLAALVHGQLAVAADAGDVAAAGELALRWAKLPGGAAFDELRIMALDRAAREAAAAGEWPRASDLWDAARQILARAQGLGSPRPLLHNLALAYERRERWEEAADAWRALLRTRPRRRPAGPPDAEEEARWAWVRARIISCYRNAGRPDEAVVVFRQMLKLDPDDLDLRLQLADALLANEQERAAQNEVRRILQIDPHHPEAVLREAVFLTERWEFDEAQRLVRALAERHPDRPDLRRSVAEVFLNHGRAQSNIGRNADAYRSFVEGERYDPENPRFPINQARMLHLLRRKGDIRALIERALEVGGDSTETWVLAIETWMQAGKLDETRALIARFEQERSPGADDYVALGLQLMGRALPPPTPFLFGMAAPQPPADTPDIRLALELLEKAVALQPDDPRILLSIATFLMIPRPDLARPFVERAAQSAPDEPEVLIMLGVALGLADQVARAKATLQRAGKLARQQGRADLYEYAQELRRVVGTPMLRMILSAGLADIDDLDELDDLDDLFG